MLGQISTYGKEHTTILFCLILYLSFNSGSLTSAQDQSTRAALADSQTASATSILPDERKSNLSILFVGWNPEKPVAEDFDERFDGSIEVFKARTPAFEKFLQQRFNSVRIVDADDYQAEMSDDFDVTIFDSLPKELTPAREEKDPATGQTNYIAASYLPADFDRPALMISDVSADIGNSLGLKLDWM